MKSLKLSILSDAFFIFVCLFFFLYGVFLYSGVRFFLTLILSTLISCVITAFITLLFCYLNEKNISKKSKNSYIESLYVYLSTKKQSEILSLFYKAYQYKNVDAVKKENCIEVLNGETAIYFAFNLEKTDANQIVRILNSSTTKNVTIYACDYSENAKKLSQFYKNSLTLYDIYNAYDVLNKSNLLIDENLLPRLKRHSLKNIISGIFNYKNSKKFATLGIFIIIISTFSFFPIYYIVFGTILIILAVYLKFFGKTVV